MSEVKKTAEDKLGELLLKGWTMLNEVCSIESCKCPLMRNFEGQKYCVNCEMWVFEGQKKREKKKFTDLVCVPQPKKKTEIPKKLPSPNPNEIDLKNVLQAKMNYLNEALKNETDLHQIEVITSSINLILDAYKKIDMIQNN